MMNWNMQCIVSNCLQSTVTLWICNLSRLTHCIIDSTTCRLQAGVKPIQNRANFHFLTYHALPGTSRYHPKWHLLHRCGNHAGRCGCAGDHPGHHDGGHRDWAPWQCQSRSSTLFDIFVHFCVLFTALCPETLCYQSQINRSLFKWSSNKLLLSINVAHKHWTTMNDSSIQYLMSSRSVMIIVNQTADSALRRSSSGRWQHSGFCIWCLHLPVQTCCSNLSFSVTLFTLQFLKWLKTLKLGFIYWRKTPMTQICIKMFRKKQSIK